MQHQHLVCGEAGGFEEELSGGRRARTGARGRFAKSIWWGKDLIASKPDEWLVGRVEREEEQSVQ